MKRQSQNAILFFASLLFALALGFHALAVSSQAPRPSNSNYVQTDFSEDASISSPDNFASAAAILDTRRTIPQTFFRGQRLHPNSQTDGRHTVFQHNLFTWNEKRVFLKKEDRKPTSQDYYCTPKAYYIFALERILC